MRKSYYLFAIFTSLLITSCYNDDDFLEKDPINKIIDDDLIETGSKVVLGKKLQNPYSVANMEKALTSLKSRAKTSKLMQSIQISTTHKYIKFKPKDSLELKQIEADSSLILYDYPLDYEIVQMGDSYHDPSLPLDRPTYQYASLKEGHTIPTGVEYEVLSDLYIPDEEDISDRVADLLVDKALEITNNSEESDLSLIDRASKWRPAGRIMVWDDKIGSTPSQVFSHWEYYNCSDNNDGDNPIYMQRSQTIDPTPVNQCRRAVYRTVYTSGSYIPVEGVKVRARRWFTTRTGITNAQGYYSCNGRFRRPANYKIKWKRHQFSIWWSYLSAAKYRGPKKKGDWNLNIKGGTQEYYATIFRAAHLYYYRNTYGLTSPPQNSTWSRKLIINARKVNGRSNYVKARRVILAADISLKAYGDPTDVVFGTTIHELAHAAHRELDATAYNNTVFNAYTSPCIPFGESCDNPGPTASGARRLMETWATTVEFFIVNDRYRNYFNQTNYIYFNNLQTQTIANERFYTSGGIDLMDNINQRSVYGSSAYPIDRVSGYTINQLENAMRGSLTWTHWRDNLRNLYNNSTEMYLNELFGNW